MRKKTHSQMLSLLLLMLLAAGNVFAQQKTIKGKVVNQADATPVQGATIRLSGANATTTSDADGLFTLNYSSAGANESIVVSSVGFKTVTIRAVAGAFVNIEMETEAETLADVVVTGVGGATSQKKVPFSVEKIDNKAFKNVPASDAAGVLQGKVAGIKLNKTGDPGSGTNIQLRAVKQIYGSNNPLIIIDGVLTEGNLQDLNAEDIASIEVVKGAAGSSLYGSRAANGVINIITKRGQQLDAGKTVVNFRTEYGRSTIGFIPKRSTATNFEIANGQVDYTKPSPDGLMDNPYPKLINQGKEFFNPGEYFTNYLSFAGKSADGKASIYTSVQNTREAGVVRLTDGQNRTNIKVNIDYKLSDKLKFSTSNLYATSDIDGRGAGVWSNFMQSDPDADLLQPNLNGTPYLVNPNKINALIGNPLYDINNSRNETDRQRFLGNYALKYQPFTHTSVDFSYGLDNGNTQSLFISPKGKLRVSDPTLTDNGSINKTSSNDIAQTVQVDVAHTRKFGDLNMRFKVQYLYENAKYEYVSASGINLAVLGMDITNVSQAATQNGSSYKTQTIANNYSAVLSTDYKGKYILDGLVRRDGVSLFGADVRWKTFYRVAGAWRISEDIKIPGIDELKLRAAYGTAGLRPPFEAQYETFAFVNGAIGAQSTLGNRNLKPSVNQEAELGLDVNFLKRFSFTFNYAQGLSKDLILPVPVSAITGASLQYQNAAEIKTSSFEWILRGTLVESKNVTWDMSLIFDRNRQKVTKLNRSGYAIVSAGIFRIEEGLTFGTLYGRKWAHSLEDVMNQVPEGRNVEEVFTINNEGYVVRTAQIGTPEEEPVYITNNKGAPVNAYIGNVNPNFNMNMSNNVTVYGFNIFTLFSWQNGGQTYNHTRRYTVASAELDQSGKPYSARKPERYYTKLKEWNNEYFVEDADFFALRELGVNYDFRNIRIGKLTLSNIRVGVVARNVFMVTKYTGYSPETGSSQEGLDGNILKFDVHSYPVYRTYSGNVAITF
ncbi:MAG: SusC/RagA family TonB-linked outer membrane protein [Agriterribacter sp.]